MTKHQPSTEYRYICTDAPKCAWTFNALVEAGRKPPVTIICQRCGKTARVVEVGK